MAIYSQSWQETPPLECRGGALTIGNFDGVHLGHVALLHETRRQAQRLGGPAVALTFDPHPLQLLRPETFQPTLTTTQDRVELLQANGAAHVVVLRVSHGLLGLTAREFYHEVIQSRFAAHALVEGPSFGFGRNREGTLDLLRELSEAAGTGFTVVPPVLHEGKPISSSRVRRMIVEGHVRDAARMLARPYRLHGVVGVGQRRGNTLGFPTANLEQIETILPRDGVYAVRVLHQKHAWPGAANVGPNPTFAEHARKVEVHLLDFKGDLYGQPLAIDFVERLRDTRPFAGRDELVEQLHKDIAQTREVVAL
jgi:riboflavin kinase/FMN adenylyltransferase